MGEDKPLLGSGCNGGAELLVGEGIDDGKVSVEGLLVEVGFEGLGLKPSMGSNTQQSHALSNFNSKLSILI